jgi:putative chitinase
MNPIAPALLDALAMNGSAEVIAALAPELAAQLPPGGLDTALRQAHFLAQACVETWYFTRLDEDLNYRAGVITDTFPRLASRAGVLAHNAEALGNAAYAGRCGNGDEASGDGFRFRGRGCLCLTGRSNYARIGDRIGVDLVNNPDEAARPATAVACAVAFWALHDCNAAADEDDVAKVTRIVNGGVNGLADRAALKSRALQLLSR